MEDLDKYFEICCEFYNYVESQSSNTSISFNETTEIFTVLLSEKFKPKYQNKSDIIEGI